MFKLETFLRPYISKNPLKTCFVCFVCLTVQVASPHLLDLAVVTQSGVLFPNHREDSQRRPHIILFTCIYWWTSQATRKALSFFGCHSSKLGHLRTKHNVQAEISRFSTQWANSKPNFYWIFSFCRWGGGGGGGGGLLFRFKLRYF